jgi:kumamolisin
VLAVAASTSLNAHAAPTPTERLVRDNVTPGLAGAARIGHTDPNRVINISVSLGLRQQTALTDFVQRVSDPRSPSYGQYLTPAQFAATYGPTADDVRQVADHLGTHGLTITSISSNRTLIDANGPVHAVEAAFGVTISDWHDSDLKRDFYGNDTQPLLPATIAPSVVGILGLNNHYPFHHAVVRSPSIAPQVPPGQGPAGGLTPSNLKTAYGVNPLATSGITGSGQGIGLFELDGFNQANVTKYDTNYTLTTTPPLVQIVDTGPGPLGPGQVEVELDIEVLHAFAPGASITVFEAPNSDVGALDAFTAMVASNIGSNSTSWGSCEPQTSASFMNTLHQTLQQAAAQGQSFFAASGDFGAFDCAGSPQPSNQLAVDSPANDPLMTGVGGTTLSLNANANFTYVSESAWTTSGTPGRGTGGGLSAFFARPAWQTGPGVANSYSTIDRQVPDVALDADPTTGYSVCVTTCAANPVLTQGWVVIGGTSAGAPSWAAFTALYNQYAVGAGRPRLGFANPMLYNLGSNPPTSPPFHDVTTGNNLYYPATTGWDYATGWGTPMVSNLVFGITQNPAAPLWVRQATAASAGGTPAAPPHHWFARPSVASASPHSIAPPSPLARANNSPPPLVGAAWAARFMPDVIARLTGWLSSRSAGDR